MVDFTIENIKRISNGWLAHGYRASGNSYVELFMTDDELVKELANARNRHKK